MKRMKSIITLAITLILMLSLASCGSNTAPTEGSRQATDAAPQAATANPSKILVAYFSATGTTKGIAERIASMENADLYEIVPAEPYSEDDLNWKDDNSRTTKEQNDTSVRPKISGESVDLSGYDTIYLGYPIWWGQEPRIMDAFVESCDFTGKTVIPFCTSGSSDIGSSDDTLASLAKSGDWKVGKRFSGSATDEEIKEFIAGK